jgi:hypothetical protein
MSPATQVIQVAAIVTVVSLVLLGLHALTGPGRRWAWRTVTGRRRVRHEDQAMAQVADSATTHTRPPAREHPPPAPGHHPPAAAVPGPPPGNPPMPPPPGPRLLAAAMHVYVCGCVYAWDHTGRIEPHGTYVCGGHRPIDDLDEELRRMTS